MTRAAADLRERAETIARRLAREPAVEGAYLFGSIARGDTTPWSDIDLLVVGSDPELSPTRLLRMLPDALRRERISLLYYERAELEQLFASGSSFVDHLRREGAILYDETGLLERILHGEFSVQLEVEAELEAELERLSIYRDLRMFNGNLLFVLAQLYAIGKAVVMLAAVGEGTRSYNREEAFAGLRGRRPELSADLARIEALRPFYRLVTRRGDEPFPFSYRDAEPQTQQAIEAIERVAAGLRSAS